MFQSNRRGVLLEDCSLYRASRFVEKFRGKLWMIFDLSKVLKEGKVFLIPLIILYQMKYQLVPLPNWARLECRSVCCPIW